VAGESDAAGGRRYTSRHLDVNVRLIGWCISELEKDAEKICSRGSILEKYVVKFRWWWIQLIFCLLHVFCYFHSLVGFYVLLPRYFFFFFIFWRIYWIHIKKILNHWNFRLVFLLKLTLCQLTSNFSITFVKNYCINFYTFLIIRNDK